MRIVIEMNADPEVVAKGLDQANFDVILVAEIDGWAQFAKGINQWVCERTQPNG